MKTLRVCTENVNEESYKIYETGPGKGTLSAICLLYEKKWNNMSVEDTEHTNKGIYRYIKIDNT